MQVRSRPSVSRPRPARVSQAPNPTQSNASKNSKGTTSNQPAAAAQRQEATKTQQAESRRQAQAADQQAQQRVLTQQQNNVSQANTQKVQEQQAADAANTNQAPKRSHVPTKDGQVNGQFSSNVSGTQTDVSRTRTSQNGRTVDAKQNRTTTNTTSERVSEMNREAIARNQEGQSVHSLQSDASIKDKKTGQELRDNQRISETSSGRSTARAEESLSNQKTSDQIKKGIQDNTNVGVNIAEKTVGDINEFHGAYTADNRMTQDKTGAGGEVHALAGSAQAGGGVTFDPKSGKVHAGGNAAVRADLVGGSGRAQVGTTNSAAGAGFVEGEAHIGARAEVGAGVGVKNGVAEAKLGGSAFAGAEAQASAGYENSYFGASVTGRVQAGAGVSGEAGVSYNRGKITVGAGASAALGLGAGVNGDVTVDAGQIASDGAAASEKGIRAGVNQGLNAAGYSNFSDKQKKEIGDVFMNSLAENPITKGVANFSLWLGL